MINMQKYWHEIKKRLRAISWRKLSVAITTNVFIFIIILVIAAFSFWFRWSAFRSKPLPLEPFVKEKPLPQVEEKENLEIQVAELPLPDLTDKNMPEDENTLPEGLDKTSTEAITVDETASEESLFVILPPTDPAIEVEMALAPQEIWQWPVEGKIIKTFGMVFWQTTNDWRTHTGIDIEAPTDSDIVAARAGTVQKIQENESWGWTITLSHQDGYQTVYAACDRVLVKNGTFVVAGQVIAKSGNAAALEMALAPHLHFEVRCRGEAVDPLTFMPQS